MYTERMTDAEVDRAIAEVKNCKNEAEYRQVIERLRNSLPQDLPIFVEDWMPENEEQRRDALRQLRYATALHEKFTQFIDARIRNQS
jgi:hypothetical protein